MLWCGELLIHVLVLTSNPQVRRSLLDLLRYCGLPWKLTSLHIHTALLNLGLDPTLQVFTNQSFLL